MASFVALLLLTAGCIGTAPSSGTGDDAETQSQDPQGGASEGNQTSDANTAEPAESTSEGPIQEEELTWTVGSCTAPGMSGDTGEGIDHASFDIVDAARGETFTLGVQPNGPHAWVEIAFYTAEGGWTAYGSGLFGTAIEDTVPEDAERATVDGCGGAELTARFTVPGA